MKTTVTAAFAALFGMMLSAAPAAWALDKAGISAAVHGNVTRVAQGEPVGIALASGDPIYRFDRITSGPDSGLQVLLLDQTTLTIGPNSNITITEFIYDPSSGVGKLAASIGKGVFRFVSGQIAQRDPASMTVRLPVATIGIRGTIVYGQSDENTATIALGGPGRENNTGDKSAGIDITTANGTAELRRPGWAAFIVQGQPPVVQPVPPALARSLLNAIHPESQAGRGVSPSGSSADASATQASGQGSAGALGSVGQASATQQSSVVFDQSTVLASQLQNTNVGLDTTFDQLRALTGGTASFTRPDVLLSGSGGRGVYNFNLSVDFGARSATGQFNFKFISGAFASLVPRGVVSIGGNYANSTSFAIFSTNSGCGPVASCQATAQLQNVGTTIAGQVANSLTVGSRSLSASGSGVALRR